MLRKIILIIVIGLVAYFAKGIIAAYQLQHKTEQLIELLFVEIASPWNVEQLKKNASLWMLNESKLTPEKLIQLFEKDLGSFIRYKDAPKCQLQTGVDKYSPKEHLYAVCEIKAKFEKTTTVVKVRMIKEDYGWKINDFISVE